MQVITLLSAAMIFAVGLSSWYLLIRLALGPVRRWLGPSSSARWLGLKDNPTAIPFGILIGLGGAAGIRWLATATLPALGWDPETTSGVAVVGWLLIPVPAVALLWLLGHRVAAERAVMDHQRDQDAEPGAAPDRRGT